MTTTEHDLTTFSGLFAFSFSKCFKDKNLYRKNKRKCNSDLDDSTMKELSLLKTMDFFACSFERSSQER